MESPKTNSSHTTAETSSANTTKEDTYYPEEEVTEGNWKTPKVNVSDVKIVTGEENENIFWSQRAKLYRWRSGEWKQRGLGEAKLLENKTTGSIRFLLRQEKTFKIRANHYIFQTDVYCKLTPNSGSDKIWVWAVMDYSKDTVQNEQFAIKFGTVEQANIFKTKFEEACQINSKILKPLFKTNKTSTPESEDTKKNDQQEPKADETNAEETKADETNAEETKADETNAEETKPETAENNTSPMGTNESNTNQDSQEQNSTTKSEEKTAKSTENETKTTEETSKP